jgi:hypothetical protein
MKYFLVVIVAILLLAGTLSAGVVGNSPYDKVWDIFVSSCNGTTTVYYNCVITNMGEYTLAFIPDQGRIPTTNGKEIIVQKSECNSVTMVQH